MKLGSLFSGAGGFELCAVRAGIAPVWASEIEPLPIAVTTKNFPDMRHLGDARNVNGAEIEPVDIITFGSPCQDLSIAGKRLGLTGKRSGLFAEAIRIIREMRCASAGSYPRYIVWENVPGAFSSGRGDDFRTVLQEIVRLKDKAVSIPRPAGRKWLAAGEILGDTYSVAWRVLDAQYFGVPQRRRRIYLVADLTGQTAGEILFERQSLPGDIVSLGSAREAGAGNAQKSTGDASAIMIVENHSRPGKQIKLIKNTPTITASNMPWTLKLRSGCEGGGKVAQMQVDKSATLSSHNDQSVFVPADHEYLIRRLTPLECGRLQGFPDGWCNGIPHSDSAEYRMWGNSVAIPCAQFVIGRLAGNICKS